MVDEFDVDSMIPDDIMKAIEYRSVEILRKDAGHFFKSDGFDMRTCEDAVEAIRNEWYDPAYWYTSPAIVDDVRKWYHDRTQVKTPDTGFEASPMVANVSVLQAPEGVVDESLYLVGDGAVVEPPTPKPSNPIVVREPNGVAVVDI